MATAKGPRKAHTYRAARRNATKAAREIWVGAMAKYQGVRTHTGKKYPYGSVKRGFAQAEIVEALKQRGGMDASH